MRSYPVPPTLRQRDQGPWVKKLQQLLNALGFGAGPEDGIFGPKTRDAVIRYQRAYRLTADGIVGPRTWGSLLSHVVRYGDKGPLVKLLQSILASYGVNPGPVDGVFGPRTLEAVRNAQQAADVAVDGVVGPETWKALLWGPTQWPRQVAGGPPQVPGAPPLVPAGPCAQMDLGGPEGRRVGPGFFCQVLQHIGATPYPFAIQALIVWRNHEGTAARWNPLATTWKMPGSWTLKGNPAGVQEYPDWETGLRATVRTLQQDYVYPIRRFLRAEVFDYQGIWNALFVWVGKNNTAYPTSIANAWLDLWRSQAGGVPVPTPVSGAGGTPPANIPEMPLGGPSEQLLGALEQDIQNKAREIWGYSLWFSS
jgi:hypothetical protein